VSARAAVSHLLTGGYRRLACITGPVTSTTGYKRLGVYRKALKEAGVALDDSLVRVADFRQLGGQLAMQELLDQYPLPDAVFVTKHS
jgi:LacI family transcriptional regulator